MLKVLMAEFFRESNVPFSMADSPKFQAIIRYLRPTIPVPTGVELLKMTIEDSDAFQNLKNNPSSADDTRVRLALKHAGVDLKDFHWDLKAFLKEEPMELEKNQHEPITDDADEAAVEDSEEKDLFAAAVASSPNGQSNGLITFEQEQGVSRWPCIVCQQRMEPNKMRTVNHSEAYLMIYLCVTNGVYTLETGKEIGRVKHFMCCIQHFAELYDSAVKTLEITDREKDISTDNAKIADAFRVVKVIKNARFQRKPVHESSRMHLITFCATLKRYFNKYCPHKYIQH